MGKSTISMVIFNSYFDITRGYIPLNPIKPPFSYGFPMVDITRGYIFSVAPMLRSELAERQLLQDPQHAMPFLCNAQRGRIAKEEVPLRCTDGWVTGEIYPLVMSK